MTVTDSTSPPGTGDDLETDRTLKTRHAQMWASGDYPRIADELVGSLGSILVAALPIVAGTRVLDVAAGTGSSAIPAARRGAVVTATDLTPELLAVGERAAASEGLSVKWRVADVEQLPCDDAEYDVVISCIGVMFAPHHQRAADQMLRVCRPGGRIAVLSWTPEGFIGQLFATMRPYAPPPAPGALPAPLWGRLDHVRRLFAGGASDVVARRAVLPVTRFGSGADFRDYFKANYGPTIAAYRSLAGQRARIAALDAALADLGNRHLVDGRMEWEYLLLTARRAGEEGEASGVSAGR